MLSVKNKNIYKYGTDIIGHNLEAAVDYIDDPANQDLKIRYYTGN